MIGDDNRKVGDRTLNEDAQLHFRFLVQTPSEKLWLILEKQHFEIT